MKSQSHWPLIFALCAVTVLLGFSQAASFRHISILEKRVVILEKQLQEKQDKPIDFSKYESH